MKNNYKLKARFALIVTCLLMSFGAMAQTTLISPAGDGGFETGTTFAANNWTSVATPTTRVWYAGTGQAGFTGARCAFIGNNATTVGANTASRIVHLYKTITIPVGATSISLSFNYKQALADFDVSTGTYYDYIRVYLNGTVPVYGTAPASGSIFGPYPTANVTTFTNQTVTIPNSYATGTPINLIFTYTADGVAPHAYGAVDDISLTYTDPLPCVTPTAQPTALILTPGVTTLSGSFTAATPAADGYLVVRTTSATPPSNPVDGTTYTAGTSALGGIIQSVGAATTFNATGLTAGTQYYFWVFSYNSICAGGPLYLTTAPLSLDVTTNSCSRTGTYSVGPTGTYTTLTAAIADLAANGLAAAVTLELQAAYTSTGETFPITIANIPCISAVNTLTIKPETGATPTITGSVANNALIRVLSSFVTIDGSNSGTATRDLTITNTNTTAPNVVLLGSTGTTPITNVTVKNTNLINGTTATSVFGGALVITDVTIGGAGYCNNITVQNNNFQKSYIGVFVNTAVVAGNGSGMMIISNTMIATGANALRYTGIELQGVDGAIVSGNNIANFNGADTEQDRGIWLAAGTTNTIVEKNSIHDLVYTATSGYGAYGIAAITGLAAANVSIRNNMIYGMKGDADSYTTFGSQYSPVGIYAEGTGQGGLTIAFNTIYLSGTTLGYGANSASIGIGLNDNTAATIKNNIIVNKLGRSGATGIGAIAIAAETSAAQFTSINNNDYISNVTSGANIIGRIGATNYLTLATFAAASGGDAQSLNVDPIFVSATDLHLVPLSNLTLNDFGTPIAGITQDIDGDTRNVTTPDMGADEFTPPNCSSASGGTVTPATATICAGQTTTLTSTAISSGVGTTFQWKVATVSGGPYSNVTGGSGATSTVYTSGALTAGTYYYVMQATCSFGPITGLSNEVTVTVNGLPSASITAASVACTGQAINFTGTTDLGTSYSWTGPNSFTSTLQNPSIASATTAASGTYTFIATFGTCPSLPATATVTVGAPIAGTTASSTPAAVCVGGTVNLNSSATAFTVPILTENFNSGAPAWTRINTSTGGTSPAEAAWTDRPNGYVLVIGTFSSNDASTFVQTNSDAQGNGAVTATQLVSPSFSTMGLTGITLNFWHYYRDVADAGDNGYVEASTDGTTWTNVTTYTTNQGAVAAFANANLTLPVAFENKPTVYVRFRYEGTWDWYWSIDNVKVSGNSNAYTYSWTSAPAGYTSALQNPTGVAPAGTTAYTVTYSNMYTCTASATATVTVNPLPTVTASSTAATVCSGSPVTLTGGGATSYVWTGSVTNGIAFNPSGTATYTVTGTDGNGCTNTATTSVAVNASPVASSSVTTAILCNGGAGTITVTGTGGTGTLTGTGMFTAPAGSYSFTVTDANSCSSTTTTVVTEPTALVTSSSVTTGILCNGGSGTVTITATGGTAPYTNDGPFTQSAGTTPYIVTDANGCTSSISATITEPTLLVASSSVTTAILCNGGTGTVTVSGTGGTPSYSGTGPMAQPVGANTYTVMDANGCTATTSITLTEPTAVVVSYSETGILCNGGTSSVTVSATGGTSPFAAPYASGTATFTQGAGTTVYTVTDANGCAGTASVAVTQPALLTLTSTAGTILCNGGTADVTITAAGGTTPYTGDGGPFPQAAGANTYTVTDANGCIATTSVTLTQPTAVMVMTSFAPIACNGDSTLVTVTAMDGTPTYTGEGTFFQSSGTTTYTVTDANGCIGAVNLMITQPAAITTAQTANLCGVGQSVTVGSNTYSTPGTYVDVLAAANTCDSTVTTTVTVTTIDATTSLSGGVITANATSGTFQWLDCNLGSAPIAGETSSIYTVTANGDYAVQITDNGCVDTSACVNIIGTGIANATENTLSVYPNPTIGIFNIAISNAAISELIITIVDVQGKEVFSSIDKNVNGSFNKQINLEEISKGLYYIKINTGAEVNIQKLIIQ